MSSKQEEGELEAELDGERSVGQLDVGAADSGCAIFTSTLPRAMATAIFVERAAQPRATSALNPIDKGVCYGMTEVEFQTRMPEEYERWHADIRHQRFLGGESFHDLIQRVEPLLMELEQQTRPVLVVAHLSTLQVLRAVASFTHYSHYCVNHQLRAPPVTIAAHVLPPTPRPPSQVIYAYYSGCSLEDALRHSIPNHSVMQLTPSSITAMWDEKIIALTPSRSDAHLDSSFTHAFSQTSADPAEGVLRIESVELP
jgi:broad specificity phosphatase PhoE